LNKTVFRKYFKITNHAGNYLFRINWTLYPACRHYCNAKNFYIFWKTRNHLQLPDAQTQF